MVRNPDDGPNDQRVQSAFDSGSIARSQAEWGVYSTALLVLSAAAGNRARFCPRSAALCRSMSSGEDDLCPESSREDRNRISDTLLENLHVVIERTRLERPEREADEVVQRTVRPFASGHVAKRPRQDPGLMLEQALIEFVG